MFCAFSACCCLAVEIDAYMLITTRKAVSRCLCRACCAGVRLDRVRGGRQKYRRSGEYLPAITSTYSMLAADFAGS